MTTDAADPFRPHRTETPLGRYLLASVGLMAIATANGAARETTYGKRMTDDAAHLVSLAPMVGLFALYTNVLERRWPLPAWRDALGVGAGWAAIGAAFELGLGHYVDRKPWPELLHEYNLAAGRLGGLTLAVTAAMPALVRLARTRA